MLLSSGSTKLKVKDVDFDPRPRPCHRPCCHGSPFLLEVTHSVKKEGLGLSAADRRWRVDCVEILGGTTDICLENRYLPMCFNMAGCVARAFFIIHAETVCFLFVGTESKRRGAVPHSSRDAL